VTDAAAVLGELWRWAGEDPRALEQATLTGGDPVLPGNFKLATAAMASIAAAGLAAAELWRLRTGRRQRLTVDARAAATAFRSERYLRVDGRPPGDTWHPVSGFYRAADGRFILLHCNLPHLREGALRALGCDATREAVAAAVGGWKAAELEDTLAAAGVCAGMARAPAEWQAHPQAAAIARLPLLEIERLGAAPPEACGAGDRPLGGTRVLDLTRVIAGPVCGRTLAEHGADVLLVTAEHLASIERLVIDTGHGKRSARLDLRRADHVERLRTLVGQADVVCQSYRPGALAARGFSAEALAEIRPGLVYVTVSAYGHVGPWRERRGFDSIVQSVSGIAHEGGVAAGLERPKPLPAQALDHATGYLAAFGAMVALARRAREGGSYLVRVSLAQTGRWIDGLGRVDGQRVKDPTVDDVDEYLQTTEAPFGVLRHVAPAAKLSETPARWARPPVPLGTHTPGW